MKEILLFIKDSEKAKNTAEGILRFLKGKNLSVRVKVNKKGERNLLSLRNTRLMIVVGGDGTFLAGARIASRFGVPVLGINEGRFGFLTEVEKEEAERIIELVLKGKLKPQKRIMLSTYLIRGSKRKFLGDYLNDVVISKSTIARIMEIRVYANGSFMMEVFGDGVIVSTPTGSTAYALSAGGPIIYPDSENILFVPICPHTLSNRPVVLPSRFSITLEVLSEDKASFLTMDGQKGMFLKKGDKVLVKKSPHYCYIYNHPEKDFFEILRTKLKWG